MGQAVKPERRSARGSGAAQPSRSSSTIAADRGSSRLEARESSYGMHDIGRTADVAAVPRVDS
jgi:hypothetical protein